jgi:hypothetical protein
MRSFLGNALSDQAATLTGQRARIMTEDVQLGAIGTQRRLIQIQTENMSENSEVNIDSPRSFASRFGSDVCEEQKVVPSFSAACKQ